MQPLPNAEIQWQRTAELAESWLARNAALIRSVPAYSENWREEHTRFLQTHFAEPKALRTAWRVDLMASIRNSEPWSLGTLWHIAVVRHNTRRLLAGDVALVVLTNGMDRHPIWCHSSRGYRLAGLYETTDRLGWPGRIRLIGCPDELFGLQPTHPAARQYVVGLRAGHWPHSG